MRWSAAAMIITVYLLVSAISGSASAFQVLPVPYDPDDTGIVTAHWVTRQGLPDDIGKANHALFLEKAGSTATNAAGVAIVGGVEGLELTELGFDYMNDGHCGAGAPRFNVILPDGDYFFFGCIYGNPQPSPGAGWTRIKWDADEGTVFPAGNYSWPGFPVLVKSIAIVMDEGTDVGVGWALLDNININGTMVGKPAERAP